MLTAPHLPAVRVVPVEGKVVGEPGVDLVQAQLLARSRRQSLASHQVRLRANQLKPIREATVVWPLTMTGTTTTESLVARWQYLWTVIEPALSEPRM